MNEIHRKRHLNFFFLSFSAVRFFIFLLCGRESFASDHCRSANVEKHSQKHQALTFAQPDTIWKTSTEATQPYFAKTNRGSHKTPEILPWNRRIDGAPHKRENENVRLGGELLHVSAIATSILDKLRSGFGRIGIWLSCVIARLCTRRNLRDAIEHRRLVNCRSWDLRGEHRLMTNTHKCVDHF